MVNFKLQHQYKQCNRRNRHKDYRRFTPLTKTFDKFKIGSPALPYFNAPRFEYGDHITEWLRIRQADSHLQSAAHLNTAKLGANCVFVKRFYLIYLLFFIIIFFLFLICL
jgi:hypothetical protein